MTWNPEEYFSFCFFKSRIIFSGEVRIVYVRVFDRKRTMCKLTSVTTGSSTTATIYAMPQDLVCATSERVSVRCVGELAPKIVVCGQLRGL